MAVIGNLDGSDMGIDVGSTSPRSEKDLALPPTATDISNGRVDDEKSRREDEVKGEVKQLQELPSKLNPMAEEFVPPSLVANGGVWASDGFYPTGFVNRNDAISRNGGRRRRNGYGQGKRRMNIRTNIAQREEVIRRTIYVSDIDHQVTEEELATLFINCGQVVDCRVCGDPNSVLRFAFIEFTDEEGADAALNMSGTMLGFYPVKVLPSKTAIEPVDSKFLPRSEDEREMCSRTIYCTNIDKKVTQADVKLFFESICGPVYRLRLLGDYHHPTRIAFVEFASALTGLFQETLPLLEILSLGKTRGNLCRDCLHRLNAGPAELLRRTSAPGSWGVTMAYHLSECVEKHAYSTYDKFLKLQGEELKKLPAPQIAIDYYMNEDMYLFDEFQTSRTPNSRRPIIGNLYDVFVNIRDDEAEHCKTMKACQTHGNLRSPHSNRNLQEDDDPGCAVPEVDCEGFVDCVKKSLTPRG